MKNHKATSVTAVAGHRFASAFAVAAIAAGALMLDSVATTAQAATKVVRDHRPKPDIRDHRFNARDHRKSRQYGGVTVKKVPQKIPCLGSLC